MQHNVELNFSQRQLEDGVHQAKLQVMSNAIFLPVEMNLTCDTTGTLAASTVTSLPAATTCISFFFLVYISLSFFILSPPTHWSLQASWLYMQFKVKSTIYLRLARWMSEISETLSNAWLLSWKLHLENEPNFTINLLNNKITHLLHCIWMAWCNKVTRVRLNIPTDVQFRCQNTPQNLKWHAVIFPSCLI